MLKSALKLCFEKQGKRDTIWQACHDFPWLTRDTISGKRNTFFGLMDTF